MTLHNSVIPAKAGIQHVDPSPNILIGDPKTGFPIKAFGNDMLKYSGMTLLIILIAGLCGCASKQPALLTGQTLEGTPICLESQDNIPAVVKKFFNTRDLTTEEGRIDYLMERVRNSKLIFIRNKVEYDSASAAGFLRWKLNRWQRKGAKIETAQDFVNTVSSGSAMSGQPYVIVLQDGSRHNFQSVLQNELNALEFCLKQYSVQNEAKVDDNKQKQEVQTEASLVQGGG